LELQAEKLAQGLAWHAVAYQSIAMAEGKDLDFEEAVRDTLHQTTDALAAVLPIDQQFRLANELPKSELEAEAMKQDDLKDTIKYIFVGRLLEHAETEYLHAYVEERRADPKGKLVL